MSTSVSDVDNEQVKRAKAFLMKISPASNCSLYDHLSTILKEVLDNHLENAVDSLEDLSQRLKKECFINSSSPHTPTDLYQSPIQLDTAKKIKPLFQTEQTEQDFGEENLQAELSIPDIMELHFYLEQAGIGLPREEMCCVALALKHLVATHPIQNVRFWGKILGTQRNYLIAEAELKEEDPDEKEEEGEHDEKQDEEDEDEQKPEGGGDEKEGDGQQQNPLAKSNYKPPPQVPAEQSRVGVNKKVYFVCNEPGDEWIQLPNCTPDQIVVARKIKKYFTGNLDNKIISFPPFSGTEANYLRAQIARISAGTQISPLGFYQFDEEGDDDDDDDLDRSNYIENPEYEPIPIQDLIDPGMSYWVHHTANILTQGRTTWWNPTKQKDDEDEEEEEDLDDEDMPESAAVEPEVGPPLLTPLSEDAQIESTPPWSANLSSTLLPQHAVAVIHSNLWPGAKSFTTGRKFQNVYIGWGLKYQVDAYSPEQPPACWKEYSVGPEIIEITDPSPEEEAAYMAAKEEEKEEEEEEMEDSEEDEDY